MLTYWYYRFRAVDYFHTITLPRLRPDKNQCLDSPSGASSEVVTKPILETNFGCFDLEVKNLVCQCVWYTCSSSWSELLQRWMINKRILYILLYWIIYLDFFHINSRYSGLVLFLQVHAFSLKLPFPSLQLLNSYFRSIPDNYVFYQLSFLVI